MEKQNLIADEPATEKLLYVKAAKLTSIVARINLIYGSLENIQYRNNVGDEIATRQFFSEGVDCLLDNLADVAEEIQQISNSICVEVQ